MNREYFCSKLRQRVELTKERLTHILERHPELLDFPDELQLTINSPEVILKKVTGELLLIRWFHHVINGKFISVVVINDEVSDRKWVVTAFVSRKSPSGELYE